MRFRQLQAIWVLNQKLDVDDRAGASTQVRDHEGPVQGRGGPWAGKGEIQVGFGAKEEGGVLDNAGDSPLCTWEDPRGRSRPGGRCCAQLGC